MDQLSPDPSVAVKLARVVPNLVPRPVEGYENRERDAETGLCSGCRVGASAMGVTSRYPQS